MPSPRDIIEARRYNRRRLVTAFASGTPDGREFEPTTPNGPIIAGVVLSLVLIVAGIVAGRFAPRLPDGWQSDTLIVVQGTGARYFTIDGVLHPITNVTSARLLAQDSLKEIDVPSSRLDGLPRGPRVGLTDVPDDIPDPARLKPSLWTACAVDTAVDAMIGQWPDDYAPASAVVVSTEGQTYVVAGSRSYRIVDTADSHLLSVIDLGGEQPSVRSVPAAWLSLFQPGTDIRPLEVPNAGKAVSGFPGGAVMGTLVTVTPDPKDPKDTESVQRYVVTGDSRMLLLSNLAYRMWQAGTGQTVEPNQLEIRHEDLSHYTTTPEDSPNVVPSDWPTAALQSLAAGRAPCAQLDATSPNLIVSLGSIPQPRDTPARDQVLVLGGSGAVIRVSTGGTIGALRLVSDDGLAYSLGLDPEDSLTRLGLAGCPIIALPNAWAAIVPSAETELSHAAAITTTTS